MTNIKTFFRMLKQLYDLLNKKQRCKCLLLLGLFLVTATLETLGVSVVLPFILAMLSPDSLREYGIVQVASEYVDLSDNSVLILCTETFVPVRLPTRFMISGKEMSLSATEKFPAAFLQEPPKLSKLRDTMSEQRYGLYIRSRTVFLCPMKIRPFSMQDVTNSIPGMISRTFIQISKAR